MKTSSESKTDRLRESSLIQLLKTLSKQEIKQLDKFVRSPFHNNRSEVTRYFQLLKQYHPSFDHKDFNKEKLYKKLYQGKSYKDDVMRRLNSNLFKIAEDYISVSKFDRNKFPLSIQLLNFLSNHGLDDLFMKSYSKIVSEFNKERVGDGTFLLKWIYERSYIDHNLLMSRQHNIVSSVMDSGIYHILNFFAHLPIHYDDIIFNKKLYKYQPKQNLIEKFLLNFNLEGFLNGIDVSQNEYLKVLPVYVYELLTSQFPENEEYYFQYKTAIIKHRNILSDDGLNSHLTALENYCINKIMRDRHKYLNEAYEITRLKLKENLLIHNGHIRLITFWNVVSSGLGAKKLDFVEKFIREYGSKLMPDVRKDMLNLCRAKVYFEKRQFERALEEVNEVKHMHPPIQLWVKFLLSKIYYELDYTELLFSHIDTFRHYIVNNKTISEETRNMIGKFLNYLQKLNKLKTEPDSGELYAIKQSLNDKNNIMQFRDKSWLLEKIEELEKASK